MNWITIIKQTCDFHLDQFLQVLDLWVHEPQTVSKCILRAEILDTKSFNASDRNIVRLLIPRLVKKDIVMKQNILFRDHPQEYRVEFYALDASDSVIQDKSNLAYYYPKVLGFAYVYDKKSKDISVQLQAFDPIDVTQDEHLLRIFTHLIKKLFKFARGFRDGYQKRVHHDTIVPKITFQDEYLRLKDKYIHWVDEWLEETDPSKHVFEDISIATFLICLWKDQEKKSGKKPTFIDLGTGNGLLVHILTLEGYYGCGIDISKRKMWDQFKESDLRQETIYPQNLSFNENGNTVDWIIGNHADELTLWIPIIAAKSHPSTCFMIIPCCFYELSGARFTQLDPKIGRYQTYVAYVEQMCRDCGYIPEKEYLRIPSTKNICIVGRNRIDFDFQFIQEMSLQVMFQPRLSDKAKGELQRLKKELQISNRQQSLNEIQENADLLNEFNLLEF